MDPTAIKAIVADVYGEEIANWAVVYRTLYLSEKLSNPKIKSKQLDDVLFEKIKKIATDDFTFNVYSKVYYINKFLPVYFKNLADVNINAVGASFKKLNYYVDEAEAKDREKT